MLSGAELVGTVLLTCCQENRTFTRALSKQNDTKNLNRNKSKAFKIIGSISAGKKPLNKRINKFEAVEIMTGGIIPKGFDTIIPIEQIIFYPNKILK